jgi:hypothetical protein
MFINHGWITGRIRSKLGLKFKIVQIDVYFLHKTSKQCHLAVCDFQAPFCFVAKALKEDGSNDNNAHQYRDFHTRDSKKYVQMENEKTENIIKF